MARGGRLSCICFCPFLNFSFLSVAIWALFPDTYEGAEGTKSRSGAFATSLVAFFLAEIGDKTQIATIGLAARFELFYAVVAGRTLGMMLTNIRVIAGDRIAGTRATTRTVTGGIGFSPGTRNRQSNCRDRV